MEPIKASAPATAAGAQPATTAEAPAPLIGEAASRRMKRRVRKRRSGSAVAGQSERHSWEQAASGPSRLGRFDQRTMAWMLGGGVVLLGMIAGALVLAWRGGGKAKVEPPLVVQQPVDAQPRTVTGKTAEEQLPALMQRSVPSILAEVEPLARKFLEAKTIEEVLPLVRKPERAKPRMQRVYPEGRLEAPGLSQFNASGGIAVNESCVTADIRTRDFASRQISFVSTPDGFKVDWESWAGWSEMPWPELLTALPSQPTLFRVIAKRVDYYNFGFTDDRKWQSYRLESPDGEHLIFGYVERGSDVERKFLINPDIESARMIVKISFPAGVAASNNQVVVNEVVASGWVETDD